MQYDPIKRSLGKVFNQNPYLRIIFYKMLDLLLLRSWHIRKDLKTWASIQKEDINILDAGAGFGQYSWFISTLSKSWSIKGVDVKTEQIDDCNQFFKKCGKSNQVSFEYADLTTFLEPEKYNLVLSVDVMEHIDEDEKVFQNFYSSMRKGGLLLISTPSDQGGSDAHDHDHDHSSGFIDEHVRDGYNPDDIHEKLTRAGFRSVEARYTYGWPGKISWKLSMKYPIVMLNASKLFFLLLPIYYIVTFPFSLILNCLDVRLSHKTGTGLMVKAFK